MKKIKPTLFCILSLFALSSHAGLLNISTNNLQSRTSAASGCAIVDPGGPTFQGSKVLVVFAESNESNSDSTLVVQDLRGINVWTNDDWLDSRYLNGNRLGGTSSDVITVYSSGVGRTPRNPTDAAILVSFRPGEAICAYSREFTTNALKPVSISITDVTPSGTRSESLKSFDMVQQVLTPAN